MRRMFFILFSPNEQRRGGGGGGGALPDVIFCSLFPVQQTTSGVGNQYAECEKQNNNNNNLRARSLFIVPTNKVVSVKHTVLRCLFSVLIYIYPVRLIMSIL